MAISTKKSLGKIIAISLASAMAMSSLSAALVSVSAVQDPALASNGNVSLNDDLKGTDMINGREKDVEKAIRAVIGADDDNHVDTVIGQELTLSKLTTLLTGPNAIQYTDSNGVKRSVEVKSDDITYRASGSNVKIVNGKLTANSAGSSTLTITVKGKVELGGGKSDKSVTLKHTIDIDVHKANEFGLVAYDNGERLTESDLNDLAAYGESIDFTLIKFQANGSKFDADLSVVSKGAGGGGGAPAGQSDARVATVIKTVEAVLYDMGEKIAADVADDEENNTTNAKIDVAAFNSKKTEILARLNAAATNGNLTDESTPDFTDIFTQESAEDAKGYEAIIQDDYSQIQTEAVEYDNSGSGDNDWDTAVAARLAAVKSEYKIKDASDGSLYIESADIGNNAGGKILDSNNEDNEMLTIASAESQLDHDGDGGTTPEIDVYVVTKVAFNSGTPQVKTKAGPITEEAYATLRDEAITNAGLTEGTKADGTVVYYKAAETDTGKPSIPTDPMEKKVITGYEDHGVVIPSGTVSNDATKSGYLDSVFTAVMVADTPADPVPGSTETGEIRFYAGTGDDLFETTAGDWVKGNKTGDKGITIAGGNPAQVTLDTRGNTGSGSVKVSIPGENNRRDELVLNVKVVKAVNADSIGPVSIKKSGSKTYIDGDTTITEEKNISGYDIRNADSISMDNGTIGQLRDIAGSITIEGGRVGSIDSEDATVQITEDGIVGDILSAKAVNVEDGGRAGKITNDDGVTLKEGTIADIDTTGTVTIEGGTVTGNVKAEGAIKITSEEEDANNDPLDVVIGGNVIGSGDNATIEINNTSDDGQAEISIGGYVLSRYVDTSASGNSDGTVKIGDADTTGRIAIKGSVEGEYIVLGGNGLVSLAGVRTANEIEHSDDDGEIIDSTLKFAGFNSTIDSVNNFADVIVDEGTVTVKGAVNVTNLTVNSDAQIVADSITVEDDILEGGSIVVPVGKLTVTGDVEDSPSLALLGELTPDAVAYSGNRGLVDQFESGGLTFKAQRQADGNYNYLIDKVELGGLTAVGKDVALGVGQTKTVSLALDGVLPQGAVVEWSVDDRDIATVTGNGLTATITGVEIDETTVTAKIVDANGRDLGYEDANFEVNVLGVDTVDSIGGDIGTDDPINELDLDTKKKNMTAGDTYTFMVRGNNDVDNLSVTSGDTNVATVALANGADARGALYNITAVADGKTDITVTYQGKTSKIAVKVGGFQLDTTSKKMAPGQVYSVLAKNVPADQAGNVTLAYDSNIVDVVKVNDNYNGRGVLFNVTAKAIGDTEVKATYNNETESMAVNVVENTGKLTLDTASYTMPFGGTYTIGVKVEKNGRELSGEEVRAMITSGELVVSDSRTGSIVTTEVQANGNVRVTGRQREGTTYVQFIVMQNGQRVTHASVGVIVQNGATAGGSSVRSISQW